MRTCLSESYRGWGDVHVAPNGTSLAAVVEQPEVWHVRGEHVMRNARSIDA